jgi:hypothetical protein
VVLQTRTIGAIRGAGEGGIVAGAQLQTSGRRGSPTDVNTGQERHKSVTERRRRAAVVVCGVGLVAALAGCDSGSPAGRSAPGLPTGGRTAPTLTSAPPVSSAASSGSSGSSGDVRAIAVAVYLAMWADMVDASTTSDYQSPRLAQHAASQALLLLYDTLLADHRAGIVAHGQPTLHPTATGMTPAVDPVAVSIVDCVDDSRWLDYTTSGQLKNNVPGGKHHTTATVGYLNGGWRVTTLQVGRVGTCT